MARSRSPDRDKAFEIYKEHKGNIDLVKIAELLNISSGTIRGWKNKDKWEVKINGTFQNNKERSKRSKGGQKGNKNAEKHGFFSKYLPQETLDILQEIKQKNPLDILWDNIQIQYAAIIRSQNIMHVKDKEEMIKVLKKESNGDTSTTEEWEFQFAWDRQANFLQAQSRAMKALESMIKSYDEMLNKDWELATEEQKARIEVLKSKVINTTETVESKIDRYLSIVEGDMLDE